MQISSISTTNAADGVQNTSSARSKSSIPPALGAGPAATKTISQGGDLMGKLQQLLQQDPAKFKEVVTKLAGDVKTAAGKATGDQASFLNKLADNLTKAADSGSMTPLQPSSAGQQGQAGAGGAGGHKHHHHHGGGGGGGGGAGGMMQSIVQGALDQVNKALGGSAASSTSSASTTASTAATP